MALNGINERLASLGFQVGIPYEAYIFTLSAITTFVLEGRRMKGYSTYRYTFYKVSYYFDDGRMCNVKVYFEDASVIDTVRSVEKIISEIKKRRETVQ